ncbi:MAG: hypothetical protein D6719_12410, partial [Candidatus Dadabacteria bacterium]
MTPLTILKAAVTELEKRNVEYCLIGGHAASLYRISERVTKDVDFAILTTSEETAKKTAGEIIQALDFKPVSGFVATG